jgi:hypothetical protein
MKFYYKKSIYILLVVFLLSHSFQVLAQNESWETYLKKTDTDLMEVTVNMDLHFERPNYKNLLIVGTTTKHCYKNGFPKPSGLEEFYTFSDSLAFKIQKQTKNKLAGVGTYRCTGFDVYYVKDTMNLRDEVNAVFKRNFSNKQNYFIINPDKKWAYFNENLLPDDLSNDFFINHEYLTQFAQNGDALDTPRKINHWFSFYNTKRRTKFIEKVKILNYTIDSVSYKKDKKSPYQAVISRKDSVHPKRISNITNILKQLSQRYYGNYDGWEMKTILKED